jgi:hypothetical protein
METPAAEIPLPVLIAFLVAPQKTVAIGLLVDISTAKDRTVPVVPVLEKVRTSGIVAQAAAPIIRAGEQAVLIASLIGARAVSIVVIVPGLVDNRVVVDRIAISVVMLVPFAIMVFVLVLIAITVLVLILVAISILVFVLIPVLISIGITVAASTILGFVSSAVSNYAFRRTIGGAIPAVSVAITIRVASDLSAVTAI